MNALILALMLWLPQYTVTLRSPHSNQSVTLRKTQCTVPALLAALEEADSEFVTDPNFRPTYTSNMTLEWRSNYLDTRTPAERLRDEAAELERKSAAAKRIREVIAACKNSVAGTAGKK